MPAMAVVTTPKYAWSVRSQYYHEADCPAVKRINKANLQTGNIPPPDKKPSSSASKLQASVASSG
jgi:hypothetical protein